MGRCALGVEYLSMAARKGVLLFLLFPLSTEHHPAAFFPQRYWATDTNALPPFSWDLEARFPREPHPEQALVETTERVEMKAYNCAKHQFSKRVRLL